MSMLFLLYLTLCITITVCMKPNFVFILTDDQDMTLDGMQGMKKTQELIVNQGMTFLNSFVSSPVCCVSRSSIMSGRYVHNHNVINNSISGGCSNETWQTQIEPTALAVHIHNLGYTTFYAGKYLNQYGFERNGGPQHIPFGWDHWYGLIGNSLYYNYSISNNGKKEEHGDDYFNDYYTDLIHNQSIEFLQNFSYSNPFLMILATPAAHDPFTPAPQYMNFDANMESPRIPNFNDVEVNNNKHDLFRKYLTKPLNEQQINFTDNVWRNRHGTLQSVDDMINDIYNHLKEKKILNNTYFIYFSDNGFQDGQFGQPYDKRQLYENDIRVPFYIRGPSIKNGSNSSVFALNIDIAPTIIDLAGGKIPDYMDGMSLVKYLLSDNDDDYNDNGINQQFLIEYYGERGNGENGLFVAYDNIALDSWNNTYDCLRMINSNSKNGTIYCQFKCYDLNNYLQIECPNKNVAQSFGEFYDLDKDYYQLNNTMLQLNKTVNDNYLKLLASFLDCKGNTECNALRQS